MTSNTWNIIIIITFPFASLQKHETKNLFMFVAPLGWVLEVNPPDPSLAEFPVFGVSKLATWSKKNIQLGVFETYSSCETYPDLPLVIKPIWTYFMIRYDKSQWCWRAKVHICGSATSSWQVSLQASLLASGSRHNKRQQKKQRLKYIGNQTAHQKTLKTWWKHQEQPMKIPRQSLIISQWIVC